MPKVYIVPTPIGNLDDLTYRAVKVLSTVDVIYAEDTRQASKLLKHYDIKTPTRSYHQHNEHKVTETIVNDIVNHDRTIALVSDAGTPAISDPGYMLVKQCVEKGVEVECLPGATAFVPALVESGLPSTSFCFEGFLPHQKGRTKRLKSLVDEERTMVFYESPYRVLKTLKQFIEYFGENRNVSVSREISKKFAETKRGTLIELLNHFENNPIKGEFVIVVDGKK